MSNRSVPLRIGQPSPSRDRAASRASISCSAEPLPRLGPRPNGASSLANYATRLRQTGKGYEITWAYNHDYILIATWNGGGVVGTGAYTILYQASGPQYAIAPGDTLTASIQGDVITMYTDGVQVAQITESTFSSGNPGFGFNQGGTGEYAISQQVRAMRPRQRCRASLRVQRR